MVTVVEQRTATVSYSLRQDDLLLNQLLEFKGTDGQLKVLNPSIADVSYRDKGPGAIEIVISGKAEGATQITGKVTFGDQSKIYDLAIPVRVVKEENVLYIGQLTANVSIMDTNTARQAFGSKTSDQFHIVQVVLGNYIEKGTDEPEKPKILVYSSTLCIPVKLQRLDIKNKAEKKKGWQALSDAQKEVLQAPILSGSGRYETQWGVSVRAAERGYVYCYRPFASTLISDTAERRNDGSKRAKFFKGLDLLGTLGGFLTATNALKGSSNRVFNQYSSLLVPGLRQLFPNTTELHRTNINKYAMAPLEEIPYGGQIERYLFLPKNEISGWLADNEIRISDIYTDSLTVGISVIEAQSSMTATTGEKNVKVK